MLRIARHWKGRDLVAGIGGAVDEQGGAVPDWISRLLRNAKYEDVLRKLDRSGAPEKHAFVFVALAELRLKQKAIWQET
jgi:hypothetical protein